MPEPNSARGGRYAAHDGRYMQPTTEQSLRFHAEADLVLGVRLRVVVCHQDPGVGDLVDGRVEEDAARVALVGHEDVLTTLAVRADEHAAEQHALHAGRV